MPELPDLEYIVKRLRLLLPGKTIRTVEVREPIVIRMLVPGSFSEALKDQTFRDVCRRGSFLRFELSSYDLIVHLMLAGRLQFVTPGVKKAGYLCFSLALGKDEALRYSDSKKMGKVYVTGEGNYEGIPGFLKQGIDIRSKEFSHSVFAELMRKKRNHVRVFLMDQTRLSAIGNAYADEILFTAGIHPKTLCSQLNEKEVERLYESIRDTMEWGIREVETAALPTEIKVRGHMRVRGRKGEPCPQCGGTIRRVQVLGYDSFFCPGCQLATRKPVIPWDKSRLEN